jgi:hypothetical protein
VNVQKLASDAHFQTLVLPQNGRPADPEGTAKMVAALLQQGVCPHCLVWSKSDTLVRSKLARTTCRCAC